jgi:hypothetical protein
VYCEHFKKIVIENIVSSPKCLYSVVISINTALNVSYRLFRKYVLCTVNDFSSYRYISSRI